MPFSSNLKSLREQADLTQEELSVKTGISKSAISMYENGKRFPDEQTLELLADFFNVDMNMLLGKQSKSTYYADPATMQLAAMIKNRPELIRVARLGKNLSEDDLKQVAQYTEFLAAKNEGAKLSDVDDDL